MNISIWWALQQEAEHEQRTQRMMERYLKWRKNVGAPFYAVFEGRTWTYHNGTWTRSSVCNRYRMIITDDYIRLVDRHNTY